MVSIDEMQLMLDEIAEEFPKEFFLHLNGGIILLPEAKLHGSAKSNDLFILGEYNRDRNLGRFISIYYGSFARVYGGLPREALKEKLKDTLKHEFLHHLESLAGERDLEMEDAKKITAYIENHRKER